MLMGHRCLHIKNKLWFSFNLIVLQIKQGFLQPELVADALEKLTRKIKAVNEEFMKTLESLDALVSWQ